MATTTSSAPLLFSVLTTSHDNNEDFVTQLRNHLTQIEANVQETLNKIQQRKPYTALTTSADKVDSSIRNSFFDVLKDVAIKNNLPFDEPLFRRQILDKQDSTSSLKVDVVRAKPSIIIETNDQHLSPVNNTRRSQFAPVLSSTPVHQTSPITPIPIDLTMATPSVAPPVLQIKATDTTTILPSAIVPQRAKGGRNAGRPPRIPRGESVTRQKKDSSIIKEQEEEAILAKEIHISSKRQIRAKQAIIEDNIEVIIEQKNEILPDIIKQVQTTPLRGRTKKAIQENVNNLPELEPPPAPVPVQEAEVAPKRTRGGRNKKKDVEEVKPTRAASARNRNKKTEVEEPVVQKEEIPAPAKKTTRSKKLVEPTPQIVENPPPAKVRATPSRGKKKPTLDIPEPIIIISPIKPPITTTKSKKRKANEETNDNPIDTVQPSSPKRRAGRNTRSKNVSVTEPIITPPLPEEEPPRPVATRTSRRGKKDIEVPIEKQEDIVLSKPTRAGRTKKINNEPMKTDTAVTVVDVVMTSVTASASIPSSKSMISLVAKPPRPPVARKKQSIAMPPLPQTSPSTPPPTQRIQSTSPINDKPLLPIPVPTKGGRRRQPQRGLPSTPPRVEPTTTLETTPANTRNQKRTRSSVAPTPKRTRRDDLIIIVPSTPGKKRNKCTCQKRRNRICDICAIAIDS